MKKKEVVGGGKCAASGVHSWFESESLANFTNFANFNAFLKTYLSPLATSAKNAFFTTNPVSNTTSFELVGTRS